MELRWCLVPLTSLLVLGSTSNVQNNVNLTALYFCNENEATKPLNFSFKVLLFGPEEKVVVLGHYFRPAFRTLSWATSFEIMRITPDFINGAGFTPEGHLGVRVQDGVHFAHRWYSPEQYCLTASPLPPNSRSAAQLDSIVLLELAKQEPTKSGFSKRAVPKDTITWKKCCQPGLALDRDFCLKKSPCIKFEVWSPEVYYADSVNFGYADPHIQQIPADSKPEVVVESIYLPHHLRQRDISIGVKSNNWGGYKFRRLEWKVLDNGTVIERVLCKKSENVYEPWIPLRFNLICTDVMATNSNGTEWTEVMLYEPVDVQKEIVSSNDTETAAEVDVFHDYCGGVGRISLDSGWKLVMTAILFLSSF